MPRRAENRNEHTHERWLRLIATAAGVMVLALAGIMIGGGCWIWTPRRLTI